METSRTAALLGPGGKLSQALQGYEERPEQLRLAQAVERALGERRYLVAEAGTGTGKTLAYLVPAVLSGRKVVVSTATKTLQDQLFQKDIPLLKERLGLTVEAVGVKGRSNYLCLHRFEKFLAAPTFATREDAQGFAALKEWAASTQAGDRAEAPLPETFGSWRELTSTSETCLGRSCPQYDACFVTRMRKRAEDATLLVVNHHLFFADLALRGKEKGEGVLPRYEAVVFDEAHALEDAATGFFGLSVSNHRLDELVQDALHALPKDDAHAGMLSALALKLRGEAEKLVKAASPLVPRSEGSVRLTPESFRPLHGEVRAVVESLAALAGFAQGAEQPEVASLARRGSELAGELEAVTKAESQDEVYWAEGRGKGLFLRSAPIDVAKELKARLYPGLDTAVFASATLRANQSFQFFCERLGIMDESGAPVAPLTRLFVPSSFNYPEQAALYLPTHLPEPNAPEFVQEVADEIVRLAALTEGRAFALFTSLRNMEEAHALAKDRLPYNVLLQGTAPKAALLERFLAEPSVLFAAHSFWEGVDVQGEALSLVILDKLPFASPADPLVAARVDRLRARGQEPFSAYQVPEAAIRLRQGFGRLIRSGKDTGLVAVLDRRITQKRYGRLFLNSLPQVPRFSELEKAAAWWRGRAGKASSLD
jgi:ATP-dependent DNA helicase DinG